MATVDLAELTNHGEVRNLSGHDRGQAARTMFRIPALDEATEVVVVTVPDDVYTITPSFFQGMFAESVRSAGSKEGFLQKYRFLAPAVVLRQIERGITSSLVKRQSIFS